MYKILKADKLSANIYRMVVHAPMTARHCQPGQFVIVRAQENVFRLQSAIMTEKQAP